MLNMPIIRIEIESMRTALHTALRETQLAMDEYIIETVNRFCEPENIKRIVDQTATRELQTIVEKEVRDFFSYGAGRKAVAEAVREKLLAGTTDTPLDGL